MKSCEVNMSIEIVFKATIKHSPKIDKFKRFGKFFGLEVLHIQRTGLTGELLSGTYTLL